MIDYSRAKEIFFLYSSSKFQMMRDGLVGEYSSYQVPKELESQWLAELINQELNRLDINNPNSLFPLWYVMETNCNSECLENIIEFVENKRDSTVDELSFLKFTAKVFDTIDRLESSCPNINRAKLNESRRRLKALRNEKL